MITHYLPLIALFLMLNGCLAQKKSQKQGGSKSLVSTTVKNTGSKISQKEAQEALDFHNKARKDLGIEPLQWSEELAKYAQEWADQLVKSNCDFDHRPNSGKWKQLYGENIFSGSGGTYTALDAAESWYQEKKYFKNKKLSSSNWAQTGHYTQMIWRNTKKLGMGIAKCKNGDVIIVANYDPPGNYVGENPY